MSEEDWTIYFLFLVFFFSLMLDILLDCVDHLIFSLTFALEKTATSPATL